VFLGGVRQSLKYRIGCNMKRTCIATSFVVLALLAVTADVYVRHEQRRIDLNRQLITAIGQRKYEYALRLCLQGADGTARTQDAASPTFLELLKRLSRRIIHRGQTPGEAAGGENALSVLYWYADTMNGYVTTKYTVSHPEFEPLAVALIESGAPTTEPCMSLDWQTGKLHHTGGSPLEQAVMSHHHSIVQALCKSNPNVVTTVDERTMEGADDADLNYLLDHGANANVSDTNGFTPAFRADARNLRLLIAHGANIMKTDTNGGTTLMCACCCQLEGSAIILIDRGVDVNTAGSDGDTALIYASSMCGAATVKRLVDAGADVNHQGAWGWTPLMHAVESAHHNSVNYLLMHGASVNIRGKNGETALALASGWTSAHAEGSKYRERIHHIEQLLRQKGAR